MILPVLFQLNVTIHPAGVFLEAMEAKTEPSKDMAVLEATIPSIINLLSQLDQSISTGPSTLSNASMNDTQKQQLQDPLMILAQSATVIKAHTTKLSLLLINEPFTPTAILSILRELSAIALPALLTAVQSFIPEKWGTTFTQEVQNRARRLLWELKSLLGNISIQEKIQVPTKVKMKMNTAKDEILSTGVIWEICDEIVQLQKKGIAGVVVGKAQDYHDMLQDAISELQQWSEEEEEEEKEEEDKFENGTSADDKTDIIYPDNAHPTQPDLFLGPKKNLSKKNDIQINEQLSISLKRLNLIQMLYRPIIKRRLRAVRTPSTSITKTEAGKDTMRTSISPTSTNSNHENKDNHSSRPSSPGNEQIQRLNKTMQNLKEIQEATDELAEVLYERDLPRANVARSMCRSR